MIKKFICYLRARPKWLGSVVLFLISGAGSAAIMWALTLYALIFHNVFESDLSGFGIYDLMQILSMVIPWIIAVTSAAYWYFGKYGYGHSRLKSTTYSDTQACHIPASETPSEQNDYLYTPDRDLLICTESGLFDFLRNYSVVEERHTKVVGVTFRNDDGTDRQTILVHCHSGDDVMLRYYEFHGEPAYAVWSEHGQIGNLSAKLAEELEYYGDDCYISGKITEVTGGYTGRNLGCNILLTVYAPNNNIASDSDTQT